MKSSNASTQRVRSANALAIAVMLLGGCAMPDDRGPVDRRVMSVDEGRAFVRRLIPEAIPDRQAWAVDLYAAFLALDIPPSASNVCAVIAVIEQESSFRTDPPVPGLPAIASREIERQRESAGVPKLVLDAALGLTSTNGKTYAERLQAVRTEQQLSEIFEDFIGRVPLGKTFLADRNPVRTGGPMQVSIAFAEAQTEGRGYPYPIGDSIRREVFTRRGGLYFGVAHLLDYPAPYPRPIYRFADFNAGRYASRNAAFQQAVTEASGIPLELDGDLLRYERGEPAREAGQTEIALRALASRLDLSIDDIRRDLRLEKGDRFERTTLYQRVHALAERQSGRPSTRAAMPRIPLKSPKITRKLTTEWFANRVNTRYETCLRRAAQG
ncbi:MAG TPA: DUF1615 domain-containing protein [Casimicrobiaceae bacterium]|nr:DUF1615 domain-containing protein [Casimicrobiaceae bacterium]